LVKGYLKDDRITYIYQANKGVSRARNKGIEHAQTEFIIFLDADDYFLPNLLKYLSNTNYNKVDVTCWWAWKEIGKERTIWKPKKLEAIYNGITASFLAGTVCYKKDLLLEVDCFDPNLAYGENYELGLRIAQKDPEILLIEKPMHIISGKIRGKESINSRLHSCIYQYKKHSELFLRHGKSNSKMLYLIAFLFEKLEFSSLALAYYHRSWQMSNLNYKAFVKFLILKYSRFS
jgi:glycosyltransferase involved in cell wall biosynthesis